MALALSTSTSIDYKVIQSGLDTMITNINKGFENMIDLLKNPNMFNTIISSETLLTVVAAIKSVSLVLCVLFFMIDFFQKTLNLQWMKWENIMMFFIKVLFAKVLIDKSPEICEAVYNGFTSIIDTVLSALGGEFKLIEDGNYEAFWLSENEANKLRKPPLIKFFDFSPILIMLKSSIMGFILTLLMCLCEIIVLGRLFELAVYTLIAPLPLSTFATDSLSEVGKNFFKSYVAVSVQALVIVIMLISYTLVVSEIPSIGMFDTLLKTLALSLGIFQSGNWAKKICSAM